MTIMARCKCDVTLRHKYSFIQINPLVGKFLIKRRTATLIRLKTTDEKYDRSYNLFFIEINFRIQYAVDHLYIKTLLSFDFETEHEFHRIKT